MTQTSPLKPSWHFCLEPENLPGGQGWGTSHRSAGGITLWGSLVEEQDFSGMWWRDAGMKGMEGWRGLSRAPWPSPHTSVPPLPRYGYKKANTNSNEKQPTDGMEQNQTKRCQWGNGSLHFPSPFLALLSCRSLLGWGKSGLLKLFVKFMGTNQQLSNTYRFSIVTETFSEPLNSLTFSSVLDLLVLGHYFAFCVPHLPPQHDL